MGKFTKAEKSWVLYDWANSVYATIIMAAIFPIYFASVAASHGIAGDVYWGTATSIATFVVAISAPVLGALGDFKGYKKKLFIAFLLIGVSFTLAMAITDNPMMMLVGYGISYVGFAGSNLFYDSFLTDVSSADKMDRVSAMGYSMGYLGGSTIPFLLSIVLIMFADKLGITATTATKISVVMTSVWWTVFSIPMLLNVHQVHHVEKSDKGFISEIGKNLSKTIKDIIKDKKLLFFIVAYFFYIDGVNTVIHMATAYGSTLGLDGTGMILALLVTQLVAVPCSILFSRFSGKFGTIRMLLFGITVYVIVCIVGFYMGFSLEPHQFAYEDKYDILVSEASQDLSTDAAGALKKAGLSALPKKTRSEDIKKSLESLSNDFPEEKAALEAAVGKLVPFMEDTALSFSYDSALAFSSILFWILSVLVGTSQGGMQALSRSYFGKIIPAERSNEFFGFFDIFGKFAAVIGPALYAVLVNTTGRSSFGILGLIVLFIIGAGVLVFNRKVLTD